MRGNHIAPCRSPDWKFFNLIMRWLNYVTTGLSLLIAMGGLYFLPAPTSWIVAVSLAAIAAFAITTANEPVKGKFIVRL